VLSRKAPYVAFASTQISRLALAKRRSLTISVPLRSSKRPGQGIIARNLLSWFDKIIVAHGDLAIDNARAGFMPQSSRRSRATPGLVKRRDFLDTTQHDRLLQISLGRLGGRGSVSATKKV
jgi:hypothetical protein